jgi:NADH-quinone oxidoreductase subunit K
MHAVIPYLTAALLFGLGVYGVLRRRNAILVLMAVELLLNAVNLVFVTADASLRAARTGAQSDLTGVQIEAWAYPDGPPVPAVPAGHPGGVFALFVIVLAAAEVGVGLAIILQYYRMRRAVQLDEVALDPAAEPAAEGQGAR